MNTFLARNELYTTSKHIPAYHVVATTTMPISLTLLKSHKKATVTARKWQQHGNTSCLK